jgi:hypothetical protein
VSAENRSGENDVKFFQRNGEIWCNLDGCPVVGYDHPEVLDTRRQGDHHPAGHSQVLSLNAATANSFPFGDGGRGREKQKTIN